MLGDKAYDSAELREELQDRGTKPVIPNRSSRKRLVRLQQAPLQSLMAHRERLQPIE
jgi:IS5 family transposase